VRPGDNTLVAGIPEQVGDERRTANPTPPQARAIWQRHPHFGGDHGVYVPVITAKVLRVLVEGLIATIRAPTPGAEASGS